MKDYLTVRGEYSALTVIEKSRFVCYVKGIENEDGARELIAAVRKKEPFATHCCYGYIADEDGAVFKFSDDGEPKSTAGLPIYETVKKSGLTRTAAVVARYFGGIKLGVGGLARAYASSVQNALKTAEKILYEISARYTLKCTYEDYSRLLKLKERFDFIVDNCVFDKEITLSAAVRETERAVFENMLNESFSGRLMPEFEKNIYSAFEK